MAEVFGVVAAAAQLATASLSLLEMTRTIKRGSKTLQNYNQNLQELHSLSNSISQNPLLQTPEIGICTESILSILEANNLASLIQKNRWHRTWVLISKEKDLQDTFVILEQRKASLSLIIEHLQARALHEIQSDIRTMSQTTFPPTKACDDASYIDNRDQLSDEQGQLQVTTKPSLPTTNDINLRQTRTQEAPQKTTSKSIYDDAYYEELERTIDIAMKMKAKMAVRGSLYFRCEAGSDCTQVNGNSTIGNAADAVKLAKNIRFEGKDLHIRPKKTSGGRQFNGNCLSLIGSLNDKDKLCMPNPSSTFVETLCDEQSRQVNGNVVEMFDDQGNKVSETQQ